MQPAVTRRSHVFLALDHHLHLLAYLTQAPKHVLVPVHESQDLVLNTRVPAEFPHKRLQPPEVVPRHPREQVMHGLELQAAVDEVEPGGAIDVHGGAQLALGEGLGVAEVGGGHAPVGEGNLDVQGHGDDM